MSGGQQTAPDAPDWRPNERSLARRLMIVGGGGFAALFLGLPVVVIFTLALNSGLGTYFAKVTEPATLHAIYLTVLTSFVVVPINIGFGICAAWAITKHDFPGRRLLGTLIDLPLSFSPVVAGVAYLFLYGAQGLLGPFLMAHDIQIMFTVPAIFVVSLFVTSPFVARALIPAMQSEGNSDEEAAISLGATGVQTFLRVSLPNIKWALLYGAVLCNARVMGEFGAVSVVSGKVRGQTNTLPLQVELMFNDFNTAGAFAAASTLTLLALVTLAIKTFAESRQARVR